MKYLVPIARVSADGCERMAAIFVKHRCDTRQAAQLYTLRGAKVRAWFASAFSLEPALFLKTQRQSTTAMPKAVEQVERDLSDGAGHYGSAALTADSAKHCRR